jgi:hypothetical protein
LNDILETLKAFNRKERFFLVGQALGNPNFKLCRDFKQNIQSTFSLDVPEHAFVAMDYHLDWIYSALELANNRVMKVHSNQNKMIHASAEDIDFLVAFKDQGIHHLIFLEAKGVTLFSNKQLMHKIERLTGYFGKDGNSYTGIVPHFAIVSPIKPRKISCQDWPLWAYPEEQVKWIQLEISPGMKRVIRCDNKGNSSKKGKFWKVEKGEF